MYIVVKIRVLLGSLVRVMVGIKTKVGHLISSTFVFGPPSHRPERTVER